MDYVLLGNDLSTWAIAIGIAAVVSMALYTANRMLVRRIGAFAERTATHLDDMAVRVLSKTSTAFG